MPGRSGRISPAIDEVNAICVSPPAARSAGRNVSTERTTLMTLSSSTHCHCASVASVRGADRTTPTLFETRSTDPNASSERPQSAASDSRSVASTLTAMAEPPAALSASATRAAPSVSMSATTTFIAARAHASAMPVPIPPLPAPITTAVRPSNCCMFPLALNGSAEPKSHRLPCVVQIAAGTPGLTNEVDILECRQQLLEEGPRFESRQGPAGRNGPESRSRLRGRARCDPRTPHRRAFVRSKVL
ncbi:unannotated protein [freshwater metagenome]|uniref:Unannotated protein n=1 Tax=freshwater metagenome TaxID=449393 RepID=A0A6J7AUB4_9ZZZZ